MMLVARHTASETNSIFYYRIVVIYGTSLYISLKGHVNWFRNTQTALLPL